ncbi:hypothetical protein SSCI18S_05851 [Sphingobium scionense]
MYEGGGDVNPVCFAEGAELSLPAPFDAKPELPDHSFSLRLQRNRYQPAVLARSVSTHETFLLKMIDKPGGCTIGNAKLPIHVSDETYAAVRDIFERQPM